MASSCIILVLLFVWLSILATAISADNLLQLNSQAITTESFLNRESRHVDNTKRRRADPVRRPPTPPTTPTPDHHKRSAKCLIQNLATFNNITALYHEVGVTGPSNNQTFEIQLSLGRESYTNHGTSKKKTMEKVSREAYALTRYTKPPLKPNTCAINDKSPINMVYEWAEKYKLPVSLYVTNIEMGSPKLYVVNCDVGNGNITTQANSTTKKEAKKLAALKMITLLKDVHWETDSAARYNRTEKNVNMHPISRLNAIQAARGEDEVSCRYRNQVTTTNTDGASISHVIYHCDAGNYRAVGTGTNAKMAKKDAAVNILRLMNFVVNATT